MPITRQTIAIIGAGDNTGSAIAKSIAPGNYRLLLFSNDISKAQPVAEEINQSNSSTDVDVRDCRYDACWEADIIILAASYADQKKVAEIIEEVATQKIIISMAESISKAADSPTPSEIDAVEELQQLLPNSKIVQVLNAADFTQQAINSKHADMHIAGDDEDALKAVTELLQAAGFNQVKTERLSVSDM